MALSVGLFRQEVNSSSRSSVAGHGGHVMLREGERGLHLSSAVSVLSSSARNTSVVLGDSVSFPLNCSFAFYRALRMLHVHELTACC